MLYLINFKGLSKLFRPSKQNTSELQKEKENIRKIAHQRYRTNILFIFTLFVLTITLYFCWGIVNNPESNPDNVKSAFALITAIVSGLVGFVTGKAIG